MTQSQHPVDPSTVAEVAPGEGPEPGSVEYGGSEIHSELHGADVGSAAAPSDPTAVTTEAGRFEDLPVTPDEQVE